MSTKSEAVPLTPQDPPLIQALLDKKGLSEAARLLKSRTIDVTLRGPSKESGSCNALTLAVHLLSQVEKGKEEENTLYEVIDTLLSKCPPEKRDDFIKSKSHYGGNLLQLAARYNNVRLLKILRNASIDFDHHLHVSPGLPQGTVDCFEGNTALITATIYLCEEAVEFLVGGICINTKNKRNHRALDAIQFLDTYDLRLRGSTLTCRAEAKQKYEEDRLKITKLLQTAQEFDLDKRMRAGVAICDLSTPLKLFAAKHHIPVDRNHAINHAIFKSNYLLIVAIQEKQYDVAFAIIEHPDSDVTVETFVSQKTYNALSVACERLIILQRKLDAPIDLREVDRLYQLIETLINKCPLDKLKKLFSAKCPEPRPLRAELDDTILARYHKKLLSLKTVFKADPRLMSLEPIRSNLPLFTSLLVESKSLIDGLDKRSQLVHDGADTELCLTEFPACVKIFAVKNHMSLNQNLHSYFPLRNYLLLQAIQEKEYQIAHEIIDSDYCDITVSIRVAHETFNALSFACERLLILKKGYDREVDTHEKETLYNLIIKLIKKCPPEKILQFISAKLFVPLPTSPTLPTQLLQENTSSKKSSLKLLSVQKVLKADPRLAPLLAEITLQNTRNHFDPNAPDYDTRMARWACQWLHPQLPISSETGKLILIAEKHIRDSDVAKAKDSKESAEEPWIIARSRELLEAGLIHDEPLYDSDSEDDASETSEPVTSAPLSSAPSLQQHMNQPSPPAPITWLSSLQTLRNSIKSGFQAVFHEQESSYPYEHGSHSGGNLGF